MPIKVYCDGSCRPNPGPAYIGVYCEDPLIEIAKRVDGYTNNAAECLAVIAGLEECQRLGLTDVEILTDSQAVVGWTVGGWKWKSSTPFEYVPDIRHVLEAVKAKLVWIPGKENLADDLSTSFGSMTATRNLSNVKLAGMLSPNCRRLRSSRRLVRQLGQTSTGRSTRRSINSQRPVGICVVCP